MTTHAQDWELYLWAEGKGLLKRRKALPIKNPAAQALSLAILGFSESQGIGAFCFRYTENPRAGSHRFFDHVVIYAWNRKAFIRY